LKWFRSSDRAYPPVLALAYIPTRPIDLSITGVFVRKMKMLTPKGEHFFPCSTRVMFDGRISLDGIATVKTL
jgi:hypothetical protein